MESGGLFKKNFKGDWTNVGQLPVFVTAQRWPQLPPLSPQKTLIGPVIL